MRTVAPIALAMALIVCSAAMRDGCQSNFATNDCTGASKTVCGCQGGQGGSAKYTCVNTTAGRTNVFSTSDCSGTAIAIATVDWTVDVCLSTEDGESLKYTCSSASTTAASALVIVGGFVLNKLV
eukprot:TRINITY_DN9969_c0_g1_i1.p1 TRINITY_DN9969_c0_g1~~TRINITY_DN9969_c0_g1_i1.p1  ORF type:complete len:125 (+),score=13.10 TRINITY_DN9969_c0_g1_i1:323-697(+)